jgi:cardiolipin synthase A/B
MKQDTLEGKAKTKNDLIRTMGECRDVTDQYQTGRSAYLRLGQLFMRLFAGLL